MAQHKPKLIQFLIAYYGLLQTLHLLVLIRAGAILFLDGRLPFPVLPPPNGWENQTIGFMFGLAATDIVGITLGVVFAWQALFRDRFNRRLGVISLTIFITGAIVFGIGTFPSGAWAAHPCAYGTMVFLFIPTVILYIWLLRSNIRPAPAGSERQ